VIKKKMKTKIVVLVGIALCTMLLISPALASDAGTLEIYGNANEDDTIDMRDLTYVKLIFFGKKPETELADAKYDGKINPLDFIQIKLIIVGKEKELTVVDEADRIVTVKKPVKRIILIGSGPGEAIHIFRAQDEVVGVCDYISKDEIYYPELSKLPSIGPWQNPDYEMIISLNPDLVIAKTYKIAEFVEKLPQSIAVVSLDIYKPETLIDELVKLGYILGKRDEATHYIDDFHDKYIGLIKARTEGLSEEERPKVYVEYKRYGAIGGKYLQNLFKMASGRNIFADLPGSWLNVDAEMVVYRNPDVIIRRHYKDIGYGVDDTSKIKVVRDEIMNRLELANVEAVKNGRVYVVDGYLNIGPNYPTSVAYWAKWFHPDLFEDLHPQEIHQEYLDKFHRIDYDLDKHGVFVYPEQS